MVDEPLRSLFAEALPDLARAARENQDLRSAGGPAPRPTEELQRALDMAQANEAPSAINFPKVKTD